MIRSVVMALVLMMSASAFAAPRVSRGNETAVERGARATEEGKTQKDKEKDIERAKQETDTRDGFQKSNSDADVKAAAEEIEQISKEADQNCTGSCAAIVHSVDVMAHQPEKLDVATGKADSQRKRYITHFRNLVRYGKQNPSAKMTIDVAATKAAEDLKLDRKDIEENCK